MQLITKFVLSFAAIITALAYSVGSEKAEKTCAGVELAGSGDDTIEVNDEGYVHISFVLTTHNCTRNPEWLRLKISTYEKIHPSSFCTIVFNKSACSLTDQSLTCHCLIHQRQKFVSLNKKISDLETVIILTLTDSTATKETVFPLNVNRREWTDSRNSSSLVNATDALLNMTGSSAENIITSLIIGSCGGVVVAVVSISVVIIKRRRGGQKEDAIDLNLKEEEQYYYYYTTSEDPSVNTMTSNVMPSGGKNLR